MYPPIELASVDVESIEMNASDSSTPAIQITIYPGEVSGNFIAECDGRSTSLTEYGYYNYHKGIIEFYNLEPGQTYTKIVEIYCDTCPDIKVTRTVDIVVPELPEE